MQPALHHVMLHSPRFSRGIFFVVAFALSACSSMVVGNDVTDVTDASDTMRSDNSFVCPADPSTLIGQPCNQAGLTCSNCTDPCSFCNLASCDGTHWTMVEAFPGPCDGGADASDATDVEHVDAGPIVCGSMTCAPGQVCVHTVSGGGPCLMPQDGGCPAGTTFNGSCCISQGENFRCDTLSTTCGPTPDCACAGSLCGAGTTGCACQSASTTTVECGCFFP